MRSIDNTPTMAEVIRERKKKGGMSASSLGTLRRKLANVARRQNSNNDSGCEHGRYIRGVVSGWRVAEVCLLHEELRNGEILRDVTVQAELAREPAPAVHCDMLTAYRNRWCADIEMEYLGVVLPAHRAILCARSGYFRALLTARDTRNGRRIRLDGLPSHFSVALLEAVLVAVYQGTPNTETECVCNRNDLDIISDRSTSRGCSCVVSCAAVRRAAADLGLREQPLTDLRYLLDSGEYSDCRLVFRESGQSRCVLAAHRVMLAARSRFFRGVMCRVSPCSEVCVDEKVLPRRFAAAILHAAYTDQVDLSLIGRNSTSPTGTANNTPNNTSGKTSWCKSLAQLEDAFQLYEIARFLEMPIVVQGCEDALCGMMADGAALAHTLRWAAAPHASRWLQRQALRMLRERLLASCSVPAAVAVPRAALETVLASPLLQASEGEALKAVIRWGENQIPSGRRRPEREDRDTALRHLLAPLLALVRLEHLSPDCDIMQQAIRRGLVTAPTESPWNSADAWLGRGNNRPCRIFLPYLDEIKALVECQSVPAAEVARERRARCVHRIPDTLYMVAAERSQSVPNECDASLLSPRMVRVLHSRVSELLAAPHVLRNESVTKQICLRAVREHSLPDSCATLLLPECSERMSPQLIVEDSARSISASSLRTADAPTTSTDVPRDRGRGRLSLAVPDVAMAPNANTHLLTARDYGGAVLQLDLGDGATHTPRPGSRAQRARHLTEQNIGRPPSAVEEDELRNAIELSVIRAYSNHPRSMSPRSPNMRCHVHDRGMSDNRLQVRLNDNEGSGHARDRGRQSLRYTDRAGRSPHLEQAHVGERPQHRNGRSPHLEMQHLDMVHMRSDRNRSPHLEASEGGRIREGGGHQRSSRSPHLELTQFRAERSDGAVGRTGSLSRSMTMDRKLPSVDYQHPAVHTLGHRSRHGYCNRPSTSDYRLEASYREQCAGSRGPSPSNYA